MEDPDHGWRSTDGAKAAEVDGAVAMVAPLTRRAAGISTRAFFAESGVVALDASPDPSLTTADYCRPFRPEGPLVDLLRERLRVRAVDLGWRLAAEDRFHFEVDGERVDLLRDGLVARASLPASARAVWLCSTAAVPAEICGTADPRRLGLPLASLTIEDAAGCAVDVACTDPRLVVGFHEHEGQHRWTNGRARLPSELWSGCRGAFELRLAFAAPTLSYWVAPSDVASQNATRVAA